jgi:hypothetical protein
MLTVFFYAKGIIHQESVPAKQAVNDKFYEDVIKRLIALGLEFQERVPWYHLHGNAPTHS